MPKNKKMEIFLKLPLNYVIKNSSPQERHNADVVMGKEGGRHSHGGGRKPKKDYED